MNVCQLVNLIICHGLSSLAKFYDAASQPDNGPEKIGQEIYQPTAHARWL